jgi:hypothetical protein
LVPVAIPAVRAAGGGAGAFSGHLAHGTSRGELKRTGGSLNAGDSALVVVGLDKDAKRVESAATRATTTFSAASATGTMPSRRRWRPSSRRRRSGPGPGTEQAAAQRASS